MASNATTTIIKRTPAGDEVLGTWSRHYDGVPWTHGQQLVDLLIEQGPWSAEDLAAHFDGDWADDGDRSLPTQIPAHPKLVREESRAKYATARFHYDVIFQAGAEPCFVDCLERRYDDRSNHDNFSPTEIADWTLEAARLRRAIAFWPVLTAYPVGARQRLSPLGV